MRLLLDTHIVLWLASAPGKLSKRAIDALFDPENTRYVSIASSWEVAIKLGSGKLKLNGGLPKFYRYIDENSFIETGVTREYLNQLGTLADFHQDPFDRLLIATALAENFTIVTADENIQRYKVNWIW